MMCTQAVAVCKTIFDEYLMFRKISGEQQVINLHRYSYTLTHSLTHTLTHPHTHTHSILGTAVILVTIISSAQEM